MSKKYSICYNKRVNNSNEVKSILENKLKDKNIIPEILDIDNLTSESDFVFVIGGDGTILKAARFYSRFDCAIFGINLGHLGFLSQASVEELDFVLDEIINNRYKLEKRSMLCLENYIALNDFVIKSKDCSRASKFSLRINDKFVCEYFADGIIVSTPTGSTAYNMASGGPILVPDIETIVITPICPHTFSARSIVVSANDVITISKDVNYLISADGQEVFSLDRDLIIKKSEYYANLALLNNNDFYSILRNKLHWGLPPSYKK